MKNPYHALLMLIAGATQKELAAQIQYLKAELEIARSKLPQRVAFTAQERNRLIKLGAKLGRQVMDKLVTLVHPDTLRRWIREAKEVYAGRRLPDAGSDDGVGSAHPRPRDLGSPGQV